MPRKKPIPPSQWEWFGVAAHFCAAEKCRFHLATRVGKYVVSTVGLYFPGDGKKQEPVGSDRKYETAVFPFAGMLECGGCVDVDVSRQLDLMFANLCAKANENHMELCRKWARK